MQLFYLAVALLVYAFTAGDLFRGAPPETFREAVGGALACALVAAMWPIALIWRGLLGGTPRELPEPVISAAEPSRGEV
ncbi:MAG TPA: hypothetical protein VF167_03055 [Longimicrobiaceae bacterium]